MDDAVDKFAPLTLQERAAIPLAHGQTEYDGELVSPIPADAPGAPKWHCTLGKPSQVWTYRDGYGATLFHILRFDPPRRRKVFLPLSLWRDAAGLGWRWNHVSPPSSRPALTRLWSFAKAGKLASPSTRSQFQEMATSLAVEAWQKAEVAA
jgi:hypothetical protein